MEAGIQAQIAWALIFSGAEDVLRAQVADYGGLLDQMEAEELAALIEQAQQRLEAMGRGGHRRDAGAGAGLALDGSEAEPVRLYIDRDYTIRLVDPLDNSFSEKASVLNARLDGLLPPEVADHYKISGANGHPRRIALDPLLVTWM